MAAPDTPPPLLNQPALETLLYLEGRARAATRLTTLGFTLTNESLALFPYRQAALFLCDAFGTLRLSAASGLVSVAEDSPYTTWLSRYVRQLPALEAPTPFNLVDAPEDIAEGWSEWLPGHLLAVPLNAPDGTPVGLALYAREQPWLDNESALVARLHATYGYCAWALSRSQPGIVERLRRWRSTRAARWTALALAASLLIPVRLSTLAPAEVVALHAPAVTAPQDGVIKTFHVQPNVPVKAGQALFSLDDTTLSNRREVALKALAIAQADALVAQQKAFDDTRSKAEMAAALGRVKEKEAELAAITELLGRIEVRAERDGIAVFGDPNDWLGRPVQTGERVMQLADPRDAGVLVWLPVGDALNLEAGAPLRLFLHTQPLSPLDGELLQTSYQAVTSPDGVASYRLRGRFTDSETPRIGLKGTARVSGDWAPLAYYVLRRPLASLREVDRSVTPLLPPLREELRLLPAAANGDGSPAWMIHDPVCNRFFRIGWLDFEMLARWDLGSPAAVVESIQSETTLLPNTGDLQALTAFLERHSLLRIATQAGVQSLTERAARQQHAPLTWLLHHYLFFRLPLARPQGWLGRVAQRLDWLYRPGTAILIALLSLVGLLLAGRQWDSFRTSFVDNLTTGGLIGFALALTCAKALHEFGHALTATRYGVRVAHMGVAMVVLWPMLYTDTSESWKLANPRQRLAIASAGIVAELALAGLATLAWSLVPDGPLRSALFFLATTSWVLTLAVNASPFMRFDGYFILADLLDMPNLHERAGHLARTWLRRHLAGLDEPWPERLPPGQHAGLIAFALVTWVYRLGVFIGIAVAVYYMFFKALGILLFLVEIGWFVLRPLIVEMREWRSRRNDIPVSRKRGALIAAVVLILAGLIPWPGSLSGAGWLHAERQHTVHAPLAGRVVRLAGSGPVDAGQLLVEVESPELLLSARRADGQRESSERELAGLSGLPDGEQRRAQIQGQHDKYAAEAGAFRDEAARLQLLAPFKGQLVDVDPSLAAGVWVAPRQALGMVIDPTGWVVEAFIPEADVGRVRPGDAARFHPTGQPFGILEGKVIEVDSTRSSTLPHPALDAAAGGPIATLPNQQQSPTPGRSPRESLYRVRIVVNGSPALPRIAIGEVRIAGEGRAWLPAAVNRILAVGVRELGF